MYSIFFFIILLLVFFFKSVFLKNYVVFAIDLDISNDYLISVPFNVLIWSKFMKYKPYVILIQGNKKISENFALLDFIEKKIEENGGITKIFKKGNNNFENIDIEHFIRYYAFQDSIFKDKDFILISDFNVIPIKFSFFNFEKNDKTIFISQNNDFTQIDPFDKILYFGTTKNNWKNIIKLKDKNAFENLDEFFSKYKNDLKNSFKGIIENIYDKKILLKRIEKLKGNFQIIQNPRYLNFDRILYWNFHKIFKTKNNNNFIDFQIFGDIESQTQLLYFFDLFKNYNKELINIDSFLHYHEEFINLKYIKKIEKRVISFSLYGSNPKYTFGALRNVELAKIFYKSWIVRIYYDHSVPKEIIKKLEFYPKVELIDVSNENIQGGMFWRFLVLNDKTVNRYMIRDIDSRLGDREANAVKEWLKSNKAAHVLRDHPNHGYSMSGGLWGCTKDCFSESQKITLIEYIKNGKGGYMQDMYFLADFIYPIIKNNLIAHDSYHCEKFKDSIPFPTERKNYETVGDIWNEDDTSEKSSKVFLVNMKSPETCRKKKEWLNG